MMQAVLEIKNVSRSFSGGVKALDDVSLVVNRGDFVVVAGSNGSGKSVLMSLIAGLDEPTSGTLTLADGIEAGLVFQDADAQILGETPWEDVLFGVKNLGVKKSERAPLVESALAQVGLLEKKDLNSRTMSGGEKRRLAVAGILAMGRGLILFDEPFANLDWPGVRQVVGIMRTLKEQEKTVIVLTHEIEKILALADRMVILDKGRIRFDGTPAEGLEQALENYGIRNPLNSYRSLGDLVWN